MPAPTTALYAEFRRAQFTYQMLLIPETTDMETDKVTPLTTMFRQLSPTHPRRAWKTASAPITEGEYLPRHPVDEAVTYGLSKLDRAFDTLDSVTRGEWLLHKFPIAVEVSADDMGDVINGATPNALIRRMLRAREVAGYGELLGTVVS